MASPECQHSFIKKRSIYFTIGVVECVLFGKVTNGWPVFVAILGQEGFYADLCHYNGSNNASGQVQSAVE